MKDRRARITEQHAGSTDVITADRAASTLWVAYLSTGSDQLAASWLPADHSRRNLALTGKLRLQVGPARDDIQ